MSSFVGHGLVAATVLAGSHAITPASAPRGPVWWTAFALSGSIPDLDAPFAAAFGPVLTRLPFEPSVASVHRGITHTVVFCIAAGILAAMAVSLFRRPASIALACLLMALAVSTHPVLDILGGCGKAIPALWPFSAHAFQASRHYLPCSSFSTNFPGLLTLWFQPHMLIVMSLEFILFAPLLLLTLWFPRMNSRPTPPLSPL